MRVTGYRSFLRVLGASCAAISMPLVISSVANSASRHAAHSPTSDVIGKTTVPPNTSLTNIAFLNPSRGYGVFTVQGAVTCSDRVGLTSNGGMTFSVPVPVVSWPCASRAPVRSLAFDDHGDGFLYGPKLLITHNGGTTWSPSRQLGAVLSVGALGDSIWMLQTSRPVPSFASDSSRNPLRLLSSINGGRTWSVLPTPPGAVVQPADATGIGWLVRTNQKSAYLASSPRILKGKQIDATPLWFTTNSGATWSNRTIPCRGFRADMALSFAPDGTIFDVCAGEPGTGNQLKETLRSTNEGRSWQIRSMCHFSTTNVLRCTPGSQFSGYLGEINAVSRSTVYLVGGRSSLEVSRDGGIRWTVVPPGLGSSAGGTVRVIFFSPSAGIVLGNGDLENERPTLWTTKDSGAHWTAREPRFG
jgi:hypothetical protein